MTDLSIRGTKIKQKDDSKKDKKKDKKKKKRGTRGISESIRNISKNLGF